MDSYARDSLTFDVIDGGPEDCEPVVLLHGFPQDATAWDQVAPRLHEAGLRTLAPHQRGYSLGARPKEVTAYRLPELVDDVLALLDAAGLERAHVVGHDWGGAVAWALAQHAPERVTTLTVLSTPLPRALAWAVRHSDQARRSWHMFLFQAPVLPERLFARMMTDGTMVRQGVPADHQSRYAARLGSPVAVRGALNWYRAALRPRGGGWRALDEPSVMSAEPVRVPTTLVWGNRDPYLGRAGIERTVRYLDGASDFRFVELDAGHWLPEKRPGEVAEEIVARVRG